MYRLSHSGNRSAAFRPLHWTTTVMALVFRHTLRISEMKRRKRRAPTATSHRAAWLTLLTSVALFIAFQSPSETRRADLESATPAGRPPRIRPDYSGLVIPPNIAPLNFSLLDPGALFAAILRSSNTGPLLIQGRGSTIRIDERPWRVLLQANRGGEIYVDTFAAGANGSWQRFDAITNKVAKEEIDPCLIYRKIHPFHNAWSVMGLYQRDLTTFKETPFLENVRFKNDCCHCHSLCENKPDRFSVAIRSSNYGNSLILVNGGTVTKAAGTVGFTAWHPSGRLLACSFNLPILILHSQRNDMRDIIDLGSWIGYLPTGSNVVLRIPTLTNDTRLLTFPVWSPDGHYLYYCEAPKLFNDLTDMKPGEYEQIRYDLMRVRFDLDRNQWGPPEMVLASQSTGRSAAQPHVSPDGRWLSFCLCDYGCWPTYHPESDLYVIDLQHPAENGAFSPRKLEINSDQCESWLSWSSNSRWFVFSSKREAPLFNRPYLAYIDTDGKCGKAFVLPQEDPGFYDAYLKTYTIPTLAKAPVSIPERQLIEAIVTPNDHPLVIPPVLKPPKNIVTSE